MKSRLVHNPFARFSGISRKFRMPTAIGNVADRLGFVTKRIPGSPAMYLALFAIGILVFSIRGIPGNPTSQELNNREWKEDGPLELSPERGRFALTYSLLEDKSYQFSVDLARFAAPDVAYSNGKYSSLFAPTVSYVIMPGYLIGKSVGLSQVGAFAMISLFAVINMLLIRWIAIALGAHPAAATIAALTFLFATPAFAYAVTLYQHHISTFLMLASIAVLLRFKSVWATAIVWFFCALSISIDNPNLFMMFPIGLYALLRIVSFSSTQSALRVTIKPLAIATFVTAVLPIAFFLYFNKMSYGNPFQLGGTVADAAVVSADGKADVASVTTEAAQKQEEKEDEPKKKSAVGFFKTRNLPEGLHAHFVSLDRGMIVYAPIMLIAFLGLAYLGKANQGILQTIVAVIGMNIVLYSMWGDPDGGWAFGSRYLIPSYAMLSIILATFLHRYKKNVIVLFAILCIGVYSIGVNTIGAVTSSRNPPYIQIPYLEELTKQKQPYTFIRNLRLLELNYAKSLIFQTHGYTVMNAVQYTALLGGVIAVVYALYIVKLYRAKDLA